MEEKKNNNALLWVVGIVLIVLGVVYFSTTSTPQNSSLKIGVLTPLTGDAASYGTAMQRAYDLAVGEINEAGGVNGQQIELVYEDAKCDGTAATTSTQKLINIDQVQYILGGTCSGETLAAAELTQQARVLLLSPSATSPDITDAGDLVYRTYPSDDFEAMLVAEHAVEVGHTRAAIISENTDFAQGVRGAFADTFEGEVVFDESFNTGDTDFRTLITKMRSANPQMVYVIPQSPAAGELILKQMDEAYLNVAVYAANTMLDRGAFVDNPSLYEEAILTEVQLPEDGKAVQMLESYEALYGATPEFVPFTASAYDSVYLLAEAIGSGAETAEAVAAFFNTEVVDWPGAIGTFNFDENGDAELELTLVQVIGGELIVIEREEEDKLPTG